MKAFIYKKYGPPSNLQLVEIDKPVPKEKEVLIQVEAVSLNASDYEMLVGSPMYTRMWGFRKPRKTILGSDVVGIVEAVGSKVKNFKSGDEVVGDCLGQWGGLAEYVCIAEKNLIHKPSGLDSVEVATLPQAGVVALQGIQYKNIVGQGSKVLINGAGGGSGTFAIQLAKKLGAEVTAVDCSEKLELMTSLGADHFIDYKKEDCTKSDKKYDLVLDLIAAHSVFEYKKILAEKGVYLLVGGELPYIFKALFFGGIISLFSKKTMKILGVIQNKGLEELVVMYDSAEILPQIHEVFSLEDSANAFELLGRGKVKGKVVIKID